MHRPRVKRIDPQSISIFGAYTDLYRSGRIDKTQLNRFVKHRPVINPRHIVIGPSVGMGVKLQQRNRPVFFCIGAQNREGNEMIPSQHKTGGASLKNGFDMRGQSIGKIAGFGIVKRQITVIDDVKLAHGIKAPPIGRIIGLQRAGLADCSGTQAGARPIGHRLIKWHASDRQIDARQVLAVAPAQKGGRTAKGVFKT